MTHWWRAYDDAIDNPKLLKLSDAMHRAWFTLQCIASANGGALPPADDIATRLRMKPAKVAEWITKLTQAKLMDNCDGTFRPHNWDDRQFQSDSSTPRVKRFREKHRNVSSQPPGNVSSNALGNVSETANETAPEQSRIRTDSEQSRARANGETVPEGERMLVTLLSKVSESLYRKPPDMKIIGVWLAEGISIATISAAVTPILKRKADMKSLVYCDSAVRELHAKESSPSAPALQVVSKKVFVVHGTTAWSCWEQVSPGGRGWPTRDRRDDETGRTQTGWDFETEFPPGYNDFGERMPATENDEDAA